MSAPQERIPTQAELEAYSLGKLDPQRAGEVEAHLAAHPELVTIVAAVADDEVVRHLRGAGPLPAAQRQSLLLNLAIEGVLPVIGGCAGALSGGAEGGLAGVALGQLVEKGINFFGQRIVARWLEWFRKQPPATRVAAVVELAELPPEVARREVIAALAQLAPQAAPADLQVTIDYLGALPCSVGRSLLSDRAPGGRTVPPNLLLDDSQSLLCLLPLEVPPYAAPGDLPGTDYRLEELVGTGGFGAVYRASGRSLQHLPLAIKFCLDRSLMPALQQERANLERLMKAGGESWSSRLVRLYGYSLEHPTPYLVYEYVSGGDLVRWLATRQAHQGRPLTPAEVMDLIVQVAEALAFAHQRGLVHRDLKPANVLMGEGTIKLADFGIGGLVARQAFQASRIGTTASHLLSPAEQASLFRGAGTPLYMAPEQRRGEAADPRHDLYSLGVMWYQLLVGDVTREMSHGWARELAVKLAVPREHIHLIERCVGWVEERPADAGELVALLRRLPASGGAPPAPPPALPPALLTGESDPFRHMRLGIRMRQVRECHKAVKEWTSLSWQTFSLGALSLVGAYTLGAAAFGVVLFPLRKAYSEESAIAWGSISGILAGAAVLGFALWWGRKVLARAKQALAAKIDELVAEFPSEVQSWGGPTVLQDRDIVQELLPRVQAQKP
jgi:serine/threonine protein kinase